MFRYGTDFQDEGLLYQHGLRILNGELPYRDFYIMQAPGTFYVEAGLIKLFGVSMLVGRIVKQAQGLIALVLLYFVIRRALENQRAAVLTTAAAAAWSGALHMRFHWYTMDATLCVLVGSYPLVLFLRSERTIWLVATGLAVGCSLLFKQNIGMFAWAAIAFLCVALPLARRRSGAEDLGLLRIVSNVVVLTVATTLPVALFLTYYVLAGGSIERIWELTIVAPQRSYEQHSAFITAIHPLRILTLVPHRGVYTYSAVVMFFAGLALLLGRTRHLTISRTAGAAVLLFVMFWNIDVSARIIIYPLNLALLILALGLSAIDYRLTPTPTAACRLGLSVLGCAVLYGGLVTGGGWGRLTELMTVTFLAYGVLFDAITTRFPEQWNARMGWRPEIITRLAVVAAVFWGALMLVDNRAFRPWIDMPLYRLSGEMTIAGARGIIGYAPFVADTERVAQHIQRRAAEEQHDEIFVFPLNSMLYPLAGVRNSTIYDTLQANPFVKEMIPGLIAQLDANPPALVVMQKQANHTLEPPLESNEVWVVAASVPAVRGFLATRGYKKEFDSTYYEVYGRP